MQNSIANVPKERSSNIELLRIISMILIIFHHFSVHGAFDFTNTQNECFCDALALGGKIGVNIFLLISGYFSLNGNFRLEKFLKLLFQVNFYSVLMLIISLASGAIGFSKGALLKGVLPLVFGKGYWFIVIFLELYLLMPVLAKGVSLLSKNLFAFIIVSFFALWSVLPYFAQSISTAQDYSFSNLGWFVLIFFIGAYIKLYKTCLPSKKFNLSVAVFSGTLYLGLRILSFYFTESQNKTLDAILESVSGHQINNPLALIFAVSLFLTFLDTKPFVSKKINLVASGVFGVYLLHDNSLFYRYMWKTLFKTKEMSNSEFFAIYSIGVTIIIFIVGTVTDIFRQKLLEKPLFSNKTINNSINKIQGFLNR